MRKKNTENVQIGIAELMEIAQVLVILCEKLERVARGLEGLEKRVDDKLQKLEELLSKERKDEDFDALLKKGLKAEEISKILGLSLGEVELMLKLREQRDKKENFSSQRNMQF